MKAEASVETWSYPDAEPRPSGLALLRAFGPGAIPASATIGAGETILAVRAGAWGGYDLLWLADCLHTFDRVGKALAGGSQRALAAACEELLSMYDAYPRDGSGYDSRDTFRRLAERVPLAGVTDAIRAIVMKTDAGDAARPIAAAPAHSSAAAHAG